MELIGIVLLIITNVSSLLFLVRARQLNQKIHQNPKLLQEYLKLHDQLQKTTSATIQITKLSEDNLMYWEPGR